MKDPKGSVSLGTGAIGPADCRRILIVGAGGFGREVLQWARDAWPEHARKIAGFLSADPFRNVPLPIVGDPTTFEPAAGDGFLLGIGVPYRRRQVCESMLSARQAFLSLVHPTALVAASATLGTGSIICPHATVSDSAVVGEFVLLNYHASVGHDARASAYSVMSPYATLGGAAEIGEDVFLGLHASVGPGIRVGARSKVSANSCVLADAEADSLVYGVPGRISPLWNTEP